MAFSFNANVNQTKKVNMINRFIIIAMMLMPLMPKAQEANLGSWNILNLKYNLDNRWSAFAESQLRSLKFYNSFHYYEYKGGVNYKFNKDATLTLGAGSYQTYKEGGNFVLPKNNDEFRLWPQFSLQQSYGKFKLEQRFRAEFRFVNNDYRNRFRYRLALMYAFGQQKKDYKPFQLSISNELFFTDKEPYFERNRIQLALNYRVNKKVTIQLGYLHQFDYKINDETGRDFLVIGFYYELFRKENTSAAENKDIQID
jgi:hypothetical protein